MLNVSTKYASKEETDTKTNVYAKFGFWKLNETVFSEIFSLNLCKEKNKKRKKKIYINIYNIFCSLVALPVQILLVCSHMLTPKIVKD